MIKIEKFIEKAKRAHKDKYIYDKVLYVNRKTKVDIFCRQCNKYFEQTPKAHLAGRGCRKCAGIERGKKKRLTTEEFIQKAKKVHKNKYNYNKVEYRNNISKVKIFCKECDQYFEQIASNHLNGGGCKRCGDKKGFTTEKFIQRAKKIHGDKYDYKEVNYFGTRKKVKIYCKNCEEFFQQKPLYHLQGIGCNKCVRKKQRLTTEEFIKKAKKVHKDKYIYDQVSYIKIRIPIKIFCIKCSEYFLQTPACHLIGNGCNICGGSNRLTTEEFIKRAIKVHKNKYDYNKVEYINAHQKVKIFCKKCNKYFEQGTVSHLSGSGCPICAGKQRLTTEEFVIISKKVHKNKYNYDKVNYKNAHTKIEIFCKQCNKYFEQIPMNHLRGVGCHICAGRQRLTTEEFIKRSKKVHGNKYIYDKVDYKNAHTKVEIFCINCNKYFEQRASSHLSGAGCPLCLYKNEKEVGDLLEKYFKPLGYSIFRQKKIYEYLDIKLKKHRRNCDYYLKKEGKKDIIVEYDGEGHFRPIRFCGMSIKKAEELFRKRSIVDELDKSFCEYKNIKLKRIKYTEDKEEVILKLRETI